MKTNYLALVACGVVNALLGMGWYGMFADKWMAGNGLTEEMMENMPNAGMAYGISFALALISAWILGWLFQRMNISDWMDGAKTGGAIGLFGLFGAIVGNMYAQKPMDLSFIDGGFVLLQFAVFGAIIGGWQKR